MDFEGDIQAGCILPCGVDYGRGPFRVIGYRFDRNHGNRAILVMDVPGGSTWAGRGNSAYAPRTHIVLEASKADPRRPVNLGGLLWFRELVSYNASGRPSAHLGGGFEPDKVDALAARLLGGAKHG